MVGIVIVSHSKALAVAARQLAMQMSDPAVTIAIAAGAGEDHNELGTDSVHISEVIQESCGPDGVVVLMDLGSAVLTAKTALELLDPQIAARVRLCPAPLVEGCIAAAVQAGIGAGVDAIAEEAVRALAPKHDQLQEDGMRGQATGPHPASTSGSGTPFCETTITIANENGLHARPAAALVQALGRFSAEVEITNETSKRGPVPGRSLTSLALLQVRKGDRIKLHASGPDAKPALLAIDSLAANHFGEDTGNPEAPRAGPASLHARPGANGIAIGPLWALQRSFNVADEQPIGEPAEELQELLRAFRLVEAELREITFTQAQTDSAQILAAQSLVLADPVLRDRLQTLIHEQKLNAATAWSQASNDLIRSYESLEDPYLKERAADIRDIAYRVLRRLTGQQALVISPAEPSIVSVDELLPSEAAQCNPDVILGVLSEKGSPTSHTAIQLNTRGIPMVSGVTGLTRALEGTLAALDGGTGEFWIDPDPAVVAELNVRKKAAAERHAAAKAFIQKPCITRDGERLKILATASTEAEARIARGNGADGIGVLRTEFLYSAKTQQPSEEEQCELLRPVLDAAPSGVVIVRALDAGADKPLPFLHRHMEQNPFLGVRGIRLLLENPSFFRSHLRAILRAGLDRNLWLMLPMISELSEIETARKLLDDVHAELDNEHAPHLWPVKLGVMVEVPSAATLADQLAAAVDFFSIGTNDLTQYLLAAERGSSSISLIQDPLHPAVLRVVRSVVDVAKPKLHVSVCGDAASDPVAAALFVGLGIRSLSVRPKVIPDIKAHLAALDSADLKTLAADALQCDSAGAVRELCLQALAVPR